ncbi:hypothetical protein Pmar_PMAR017065 [Perkinsus marinus ATCC 50983]|uniref:Uncharacterized protein n=1 Tax=Perkinsus marinus (strain ATCC 50983 / TXsc) TaxID=423536 RepID=C5LSG6_PERM5|nr:hypothetical protein Pmar_PMAR017065 [Perkinsus marinus ATCC 50983]EER00207.1 hypothetical protein Pmar_PMAR017065 [Perkinsus marinus ATCC 50983]|eukprot:XP_002767489.1 hypothetical protein Pmar_PMAR017065 [Perkinsus marinus ATCC 50983]
MILDNNNNNNNNNNDNNNNNNNNNSSDSSNGVKSSSRTSPPSPSYLVCSILHGVSKQKAEGQIFQLPPILRPPAVATPGKVDGDCAPYASLVVPSFARHPQRGSNLNDNLRIYENGTFDFEGTDKASGVSGTACVPICYPSGEQQKTVCAVSKHQREAPLSQPVQCSPAVHAFKTIDGLVVLSGTVEAPPEPTIVGTIPDPGMRPRETVNMLIHAAGVCARIQPDGSVRVVHGNGGRVSLDGVRFIAADCDADEYPLLGNNRQKLTAVVLRRSKMVVLSGKAKADGATVHSSEESNTSTLIGVLPPEVPPPRRLILQPVLSSVCVAVTTAGDVLTTRVGRGARFVSLSGVVWPYPYGADNVNTQSVPVPRAAKSAPPPRMPGLNGNFRKLMDDQDLFQCMYSMPAEHREYLFNKVKENLEILVFTEATGHQAKDYVRFLKNRERMKRNQTVQRQHERRKRESPMSTPSPSPSPTPSLSPTWV